MNAKIQAWRDGLVELQATFDRVNHLYIEAIKEQPPANLRPATIHDLLPGALLWYPAWPHRKWALVGEVVEAWRSTVKYRSEDGTIYELDGAFVEVE